MTELRLCALLGIGLALLGSGAREPLATTPGMDEAATRVSATQKAPELDSITRRKALWWDIYQDGTFGSRLRFALDGGLSEQKTSKTVARACLALLFTDDPALIGVAGGMSISHGDKLNSEMLPGALRRLRRDVDVVNHRFAAKRLGYLSTMATHQKDGAAYAEIAIRHLEGSRAAMVIAIHDLHEIRPALVAAFGADGPPPLPLKMVGKDVRLTLQYKDRKGVKRLSKAWQKWFDECDKAKLSRAAIAAVIEYWRKLELEDERPTPEQPGTRPSLRTTRDAP